MNFNLGSVCREINDKVEKAITEYNTAFDSAQYCVLKSTASA